MPGATAVEIVFQQEMLLALVLLSLAGQAQTKLNVYAAFSLDSKNVLSLEIHCPSSNGDWTFDTSKAVLTVDKHPAGCHPSLSFNGASGTITPQHSRYDSYLILPLKFDRGGTAGGWNELDADLSIAIQTGGKPYTVLGYEPYRLYLGPDPSVDDLSALRKKWVGKTIWVIGSAAYGNGFSMFAWNPMKPAKILSIQRSSGGIADLLPPPVWPLFDGWDPGQIKVSGPLTISIQVPAEKVRHEPSGVSEYGPEFEPQFSAHGTGNTIAFGVGNGGPSPRKGSIVVSDEWQFPYFFTTSSPANTVSASSASVKKAFTNHMVIKGMPRELVARLIGYPSLEEPIGKQNKMRTWAYEGNAPVYYEVDLDSNGLVKSAKQIGKLP